MSKAVWINNSRVGRYLSQILGNQSEKLAFAVSKLISVVVPLDLLAFEPQTVPVAATAGNAVVTVAPGLGHRLRLVSSIISVTTDATVANRYLKMTIYDKAGNLVGAIIMSAAIAASQTGIMVATGPVTLVSASSSVGNNHYAGFGTECIVYPGDYLKIELASGVAGDSYSGFLKILWM